MLFERNCPGTINFVKITKQLFTKRIPSHVLLQTGTNQWQQHRKENALVELFCNNYKDDYKKWGLLLEQTFCRHFAAFPDSLLCTPLHTNDGCRKEREILEGGSEAGENTLKNVHALLPREEEGTRTTLTFSALIKWWGCLISSLILGASRRANTTKSSGIGEESGLPH